MRRTDLVRFASLAVAVALLACAGAGPSPRAPDTPSLPPTQSGNAVPLQDLLARLEILIAAGDADGRGGALLSEARALRIEALAALAAGDDTLARDLLSAAIALFGDGQG